MRHFKLHSQTLKQIELLIKEGLQQPKANNNTVEELQKTPEKGDLLNILKGLPKAELRLFRTLYELQLSLNAKHISYKSLAKYLYPEKEYNSIRSSITQFVLRLNTEGLVDKKRIGKETYVRITPIGHNLLKKTNKQLIEVQD